MAADFANGIPPEQLGRPIAGDPVRLAVAEPRRDSDGSLSGDIVSIDRFGNLISNIPAAWVATGRWRCRIGGHEAPLLSTYADVSSDVLVGLVGSDGAVEIAVRNGNAAHQLGVGIGAPIERSGQRSKIKGDTPMERLVIKGGHPLSGDVVPAGNKNAALPIWLPRCSPTAR